MHSTKMDLIRLGLTWGEAEGTGLHGGTGYRVVIFSGLQSQIERCAWWWLKLILKLIFYIGYWCKSCRATARCRYEKCSD